MDFEQFAVDIVQAKRRLQQAHLAHLKSCRRFRAFSVVLYPICAVAQWTFLFTEGTPPWTSYLYAAFMTLVFAVLGVVAFKTYTNTIRRQENEIAKKRLLGESPWDVTCP